VIATSCGNIGVTSCPFGYEYTPLRVATFSDTEQSSFGTSSFQLSVRRLNGDFCLTKFGFSFRAIHTSQTSPCLKPFLLLSPYLSSVHDCVTDIVSFVDGFMTLVLLLFISFHVLLSNATFTGPNYKYIVLTVLACAHLIFPFLSLSVAICFIYLRCTVFDVQETVVNTRNGSRTSVSTQLHILVPIRRRRTCYGVFYRPSHWSVIHVM